MKRSEGLHDKISTVSFKGFRNDFRV